MPQSKFGDRGLVSFAKGLGRLFPLYDAMCKVDCVMINGVPETHLILQPWQSCKQSLRRAIFHRCNEFHFGSPSYMNNLNAPISGSVIEHGFCFYSYAKRIFDNSV